MSVQQRRKYDSNFKRNASGWQKNQAGQLWKWRRILRFLKIFFIDGGKNNDQGKDEVASTSTIRVSLILVWTTGPRMRHIGKKSVPSTTDQQQ